MANMAHTIEALSPFAFTPSLRDVNVQQEEEADVVSPRRTGWPLRAAANHRPRWSLDSKSGTIPSFVHPRIFSCGFLLFSPHASRPAIHPPAHRAHAGRPARRTTATAPAAKSWERARPLVAEGGNWEWALVATRSVTLSPARLAWLGEVSSLNSGSRRKQREGAFNPKAHHLRCARSRRRTLVAKSPRGHPVLLG